MLPSGYIKFFVLIIVALQSYIADAQQPQILGKKSFTLPLKEIEFKLKAPTSKVVRVNWLIEPIYKIRLADSSNYSCKFDKLKAGLYSLKAQVYYNNDVLRYINTPLFKFKIYPNTRPIAKVREGELIKLDAYARETVIYSSSFDKEDGKAVKLNLMSHDKGPIHSISKDRLTIKNLKTGKTYNFTLIATDKEPRSSKPFRFKIITDSCLLSKISINGEKILPNRNIGYSYSILNKYGPPIVKYSWEFDGKLMPIVTNTFNSAGFPKGLHTLRATVVNDCGKSSDTSIVLKVFSEKPALLIANKQISVFEKSRIYLNYTAVDDEDSLKISWQTGNGVVNSHTDNTGSLLIAGLTPGNYTVTVTATDKDGQLAMDNASIEVKPIKIIPPQPCPPMFGGPGNALYSFLLPGVLSQNKVRKGWDKSNDNHAIYGILTTVVYAGSIVVGAVSYLKYDNDYKKYKELANFREYQRDANGNIIGIRGAIESGSEVQRYYNSAQGYYKWFKASAIIGACTIAGDFIYTFAKGFVNKRNYKRATMGCVPKIGLGFNHATNQIQGSLVVRL